MDTITANGGEKQSGSLWRGKQMDSVLSGFMPMFYTYINRILNHFKNQQFELNENQIKVIMTVSYVGEISPAEISRVLHIFKGSLTTMIRKLVNMQMLIRHDDPQDARKYYLTLSKKAQAFIDAKQARDIRSLDQLFLEMPEGDFLKVCEGITILADYLKEKGKK